MADVLFDFDNPSDAARSLKRVAQAMQRAGQPVVSHDFDAKLRRTSGINYRQALLTLASGQTVTLMVKQTGDVFRVLLNGAVLPIKNQEGIKAIGEIAAAAERNQAKFQAAQARQKVALPKGIRTAAPKMAEALALRNTELDAQIAEKTAERDALKAELGDALDSVGASGTVLSDAALEVLAQVAAGPVEDGDLVSKAGRDELIDAGFIDRYTDEGDNVINDAGRAYLAETEELEPAEGQESLFGGEAA